MVYSHLILNLKWKKCHNLLLQLSYLYRVMDNSIKNCNSVIIKIKDRGLGIENDEKDKIFEKFYRGTEAVKYSIKGTGLGLALVKYTVEAHNGHIDVKDEPGWSAVFMITLPIPDHN